MKNNPDIVKQYGDNMDVRTSAPISTKPLPTKYDYTVGIFYRYFAKKINENVLVEIKSEDIQKINASLYTIATVNWKITGPRENKYTNNFIDGTGVIQQNLHEIERVYKEYGVDLKNVLPNPLEYWRGY
jgi:hypothetical protein